jgi:hypothetical protein
VVARLDEALAERVGPPDHLIVDAQDQQQRLTGRAEGLVRDLGVAVQGVLDAHIRLPVVVFMRSHHNGAQPSVSMQSHEISSGRAETG